MDALELKTKLDNIATKDFSIVIEEDVIELSFYHDKRDGAICVTNKAYKGFSPCDCYENSEEGKEYVMDFVKRVYPEIL